MSYFAKPNFIVYDEWFDNNLKKITIDEKNKKTTKNLNIHEFFYKQSNYKVGASENKMQIDIDVKRGELLNNYFENYSENYSLLSNKKFLLFEKLTKNKLKFIITKKIIYSLSIFGFVFIMGFLLFFISQSKKNESNITNKIIELEKVFFIF